MFPAEEPAAGPQAVPGLILTLPIMDRQNPPPPERVPTPDPPAPAIDDAILANVRNQIINQFRDAPNLHNVTNSEDWSLADPHTLLHLLTNPSEDQSAILQLLAPELDLATATDIWDAWALAFAHTDGTLLTTEFRDISIATLTSLLITPEALSAQTTALAQWALYSCPNEFLQLNTEISEEDLLNLGEEDEMNWFVTRHLYCPTLTPHPTFFPLLWACLYCFSAYTSSIPTVSTLSLTKPRTMTTHFCLTPQNKGDNIILAKAEQLQDGNGQYADRPLLQIP